MSRSAGSNNLTDKEFSTIKMLLDKGASVKEIRDCTGRSERTIRRCKNVSTPEEFRRKNKEERKARNDQKYLDSIYEAFGNEPVVDDDPLDDIDVYHFLRSIHDKYDLSDHDERLRYAIFSTDVLRVVYKHGIPVDRYIGQISLETGYQGDTINELITKG